MSVLNRSIIFNVFKSFEKGRKLEASIIASQDVEIQKAVDAMVLACDTTKAEFMKGNAKTNPARHEVKALFMGLFEAGFIGKTTAENYQSSFWIAFEQGIPFSRDLVKTHNKNQTEKKTEESKKAGPVKSTTREALDKSIYKVVEQANLLGLKGFAIDLIDLATEQLDGFKADTE